MPVCGGGGGPFLNGLGVVRGAGGGPVRGGGVGPVRRICGGPVLGCGGTDRRGGGPGGGDGASAPLPRVPDVGGGGAPMFGIVDRPDVGGAVRGGPAAGLCAGIGDIGLGMPGAGGGTAVGRTASEGTGGV